MKSPAGLHPPLAVEIPMTFDLPQLERLAWLGRVVYRDCVTSSNDLARQLAAETKRETTLLVLAEEQTAGRGRGANRWWTGPGSLAFSLLIDSPAWGIERRHSALISLAAAVAIVETVAPLVPDKRVGIHWPNDVFVAGRKLAGILVESLPDGRHIIGIGLNVNNSLGSAPAELQATIASLVELTGRPHERTAVLVELLGSLAAALRALAASPATLAQRADSFCLQHGQKLEVETAGRIESGICAGIADDGALVLDTPTGPRTIYSGVLIKQTPGQPGASATGASSRVFTTDCTDNTDKN